MSCRATVVVTDADGGASPQHLADLTIARLAELEQRWSRFLPTSELTALNDACGAPLAVSADTVELVNRLVQAWHLTDGAFDPTLLGTLVELGYAASRDDATLRTSLHPSVIRRGRPEDVLVDATAGVVQLPAGTVLDPGGLGKGLAADIVVAELLAAGATGALVEIGGDLRAAGESPDGGGWLIDVDTATDARVHLRIADGAVATSTSRLRTWSADGETRHHLIDPATLRPSARTAVSCTVVAGSGAWAEAFTKVAFAHDPADAIERLERLGLAASVTVAGGASTGRLTTSSWQLFQQ
jgi:thiamine biosynthesis lipoprotein